MQLIFFGTLIALLIDFAGSQTCECIQPTSTGQPPTCLDYDSRMQADTLDEAIASFPDLTLNGADAEMPTDVGCTTEQCQDCQKKLKKRLKSIGLLPHNITDIINQQVNDTTTCDKYRFTSHPQLKATEGETDDSSSSESENKEEKREKNRKLREKKQKKRDKRQVTIAPPIGNETVVGERFTISCTVKGMDIDPSGTVSLCSSCWVWRKLPNNYRPQYINELVCDTTDDTCLSGYATCSVGHRTFDAVRTDNGVSTTVTLTAGSYCECRISSASSLTSLVTGSGISGSFQPVSSTIPQIGIL